MNIKARLAKLERVGSPSDLSVWCDNHADVPAAIAAMLVEGEVTKADAGRCVFLLLASARRGTHEASLIELA